MLTDAAAAPFPDRAALMKRAVQRDFSMWSAANIFDNFLEHSIL
jgi:hypothetical protein